MAAEDGRARDRARGTSVHRRGRVVHFDGAAVATKPLDEKLALRLKVYGGVPVHFYEAPASGDWLAGVQASAEPWKDGRAAIDYAHVEDELSGYDDQRNDLAAVSVWQRIGKDADLFGRFTWLDGPSDFRLRGTVNFPESDLLVQASYKRLLDDKEDYATEFDPYFRTLRTLREYHLGDVRAVKRLGFKAASTLQDALEMAEDVVGPQPTITHYKNPPLVMADVK